MACPILITSLHLARILALLSSITQPFGGLSNDFQKNATRDVPPALVRVSIITESRGAQDTFEINGKVLRNYNPVLIQVFSSTGIVLDRAGHVLTFLGYRWVDIQRNSRIEITASGGQKWKGRLVGIDQTNGAAVIRTTGAKLRKTAVCTTCEIKNGATIVSPVEETAEISRFREAQIISVGTNQGVSEQDRWVIKLNHPFPDVGQPILTTDRRVIGFVASQDPLGATAIVYPMSTLLSSADRIIKSGGDIQAGWLGIFVSDLISSTQSGVVVQQIEPASPAEKAGLVPKDFLLRYNGQEIADALQFIELVQSTPVGTNATLEISREGKPVTLTALIEPRRREQDPGGPVLKVSGVYEAAFASGTGLNPQPVIGLDTIVITPALSEALKIPFQRGLLVIDVAKGKPADAAGIRVGDVILSIDGQPIVDAVGFASYLQTRDWGSLLLLETSRKGTERTVPVQVPEKR